ncbi:diguanylate cyclase [Undibacterium sp. LX40W]|uniref:diguanylate cyclase n=1 Tax=Undibacterium nitidum TaxID=2762298 RepID=A0A923KRI0_9BURK|nr:MULTISPECIES: diguanylate cyclase [Undibacterium]MBC3880231.1 diguanylate cyclase [Undibacterium nitidum]MBC3891033.1 diguanylate cyclase [Undibacterium sp. LX40W]
MKINGNTRTSRPLILIVDDSPEVIKMLSQIVLGMADVVFALDGKSGIEFANKQQPTLVLLDVNMPGQNGYEVCKNLKSNVITKDIPIIFVTGETSMDAEVRALEAGAVDFISKPLNPPVVAARVGTHLTLRQNAISLELLVNQDPLTCVYNRRYFDHQLEKEYGRHLRQKLPLSVVIMDIDHFKDYNDKYGHLEGDKCLINVVSAIDAVTRRPGEIFARYGGEEFIAILPYVADTDLKKYCQQVCSVVRGLEFGSDNLINRERVTISVGACSGIPTKDVGAIEFTRQADRALYEAKTEGRDRFKMYVNHSCVE